jgi:DNA-binding response OmpR family regulator
MARILLVEDDLRISEPLARMLQVEGFDVEHHDTGLGALDSVHRERPDLVLLDLTLPDLDGVEVCRTLRGEDPSLPIVMLTARSEEVDVVVGLGAGADDYVAKPFRVAELLARIRARLRAAEATREHAAPNVLTGGGVRLDLDARRAFVDESEVELTPKEFDLLALLMREAGRAVRREDIMAQVWDEHWWGPTRTLDTHVSTLRRKLGDTSDPPRLVVTVRGVGFRFEG